VAIAVAVGSGGGGKKGIQSGTTASQTVSTVSSLLNGIPQSGSTLGKSSAPVSIQYYGDLECPICKDFTVGTLPELIAKQVRTGKATLEYRSLQSATHETSTYVTQQVAAEAAGQQNREWQFVELFYHQQGAEGTPYVTESYLNHIAGQVAGLDLAKWSSARNSAALTEQVQADAAAASQVGASSTPTIVVKGPNGIKGAAGDLPYSDVLSMIKAVGPT
jgi:protein-disulfide isomerase